MDASRAFDDFHANGSFALATATPAAALTAHLPGCSGDDDLVIAEDPLPDAADLRLGFSLNWQSRTAINSSPPQRPMKSVGRKADLVFSSGGELLQHLVAGQVPQRVVEKYCARSHSIEHHDAEGLFLVLENVPAPARRGGDSPRPVNGSRFAMRSVSSSLARDADSSVRSWRTQSWVSRAIWST